ncbi:MAG: hypothetical protein M1824_002639 [Vezdaea acicularis]|nr:MAG: hypothetical protein M1824_002639 [Vezdaea acicularis]
MSVSKKVDASNGSGQGLRTAIRSSRYSSSVQETAVSTNPSQSRTVDSSYFNGDSTTTASAAYEDIDRLRYPLGSYDPYQGQLHRSSFGSESNRDYVTASRHSRIAQPGDAIYGMAQFDGVPTQTARQDPLNQEDVSRFSPAMRSMLNTAPIDEAWTTDVAYARRVVDMDLSQQIDFDLIDLSRDGGGTNNIEDDGDAGREEEQRTEWSVHSQNGELDMQKQIKKGKKGKKNKKNTKCKKPCF